MSSDPRDDARRASIEQLSAELAVEAAELAGATSGGRDRLQAALRALAERSGTVRDRTGALVDAVLDRVFDAPLEVRDAAHAEQLLLEAEDRPLGGETASRVAAGLTAAGPVLRRVGPRILGPARVAGKATSASRVLGSAVLISTATRVASSVQRGVRELQVVASVIVGEARAAGVEPDRPVVRRLTLAAYLEPRDVNDHTAWERRAIARLARHWLVRAGIGEPAVLAGKRRRDRVAAAVRAGQAISRRSG